MSVKQRSGLCLSGPNRLKMIPMQTYQVMRKERINKKTGVKTTYYWAEGLSDSCPKQTLQGPVSYSDAMAWQTKTGKKIIFSPVNPENQKKRVEKQLRKKARVEKKKEAEKEKKRKEKEKAKKMAK